MNVRAILITLFLTTITATAAGAGQEKLDLLLRDLDLPSSPTKAMLGKAVAASPSGAAVEVLIKSTEAVETMATIEADGGQIRTQAGDIIVALVPLVKLRALADRDDVVFIEASKRLSIKMDTARTATHVDSLQSGATTGSALTGRNVVVGVIDDGFDYGNDDFKGSDGKTRVQFVRQCVNAACTTFRVCVKSQIDDASCTIGDGGQGTYHGTHVTGIATSAHATYKGIAPDADIMFIFNSAGDPPNVSGALSDLTTFSGAVIEGVTQIFRGATRLNKPAVVNLSLGTSLGAHDDTSLLEQGLNNLVGGAGRAIVNAAGNEKVNPLVSGTGAGGIHADVNLSVGQSKAWRFVVTSSGIASFNTAVADIWLAQGNQCPLEARAYRATAATTTTSSRATVGPQNSAENHAAADNTAHDGTVLVTLATAATDTNNNRPHAQVTLTTDSGARWQDILSNGDTTIDLGESTTGGYVFDVIVRATTTTCTGSIWLYPDQTTIVDFLTSIDGVVISGASSYQLANGDSNKTMTIPGTASGVITAGSYMQEKPIGSGAARWTDINGTTHNQTDINDQGTGGTVKQVSLFSSLGPTGEISSSRTKPDVVSPGEPVISTLARGASVGSSSKVDSSHIKLEGSSMASPHVAGIVALLFQYNNTLTAAQVKDLLTSSAVRLTGQTATNNSAGNGLVDAAAAVARTTADSSAFSGTRSVTTDDVNDTGFKAAGDTATSSSSGGCGSSTLTNQRTLPPSGMVGLVILLLPALIFARCRRKKKG